MEHRMIQLQRLGLVVLVFLTTIATAACTAADSTGEVALPLLTTTPDGASYRLRDGRFQITGSTGIGLGLTTESNPDALELHVDLAADWYNVELLAGWRMERSIDGSPFEPVAAELAAARHSVEVVDGRSSRVSFVFRVAGVGDLELGGGIDIGIDVFTLCDPTAQSGCATGERCSRVALLDGSAVTTCVPDGTVPEGGACVAPQFGADDCVAGTKCHAGTCAAICIESSAGCECTAPGYFPEYASAGVCVSSCDPLAQDCGDPALGCYPTGASTTCAPPVAPAGNPGDPCTQLNQCAPGSVCTGAGGCALMCAVSGVGPDCSGQPGASIQCASLGLGGHPDAGVCLDCTVFPEFCTL
jgi:hypothetical protein